ncbi:MAG: BMP family ABC transporter substrate-binding protein [Anaerolineales bacterium]|nr:BMP family ABC transporter substrate-binding protein [Anaerolineales bacterium]MCX7609217.1 BMP family ABC transporter substrate-binding protein [Anaerolineales bacterium]
MRTFFARLVALMVIAVLALSACAPQTGGQQDGAVVSGKSIKACYIYVGPIGDLGWTHAHDQGRKYVDDKYDWLTTVYVESVPESDAARFIDRFVNEEKCDVIFTTSFGYMEDTLKAAQKYPDKIFVHVSGFKRAPNMATMMADFYQIYYLNGLMAGALTKSGKIGYVGAHPIPEVVRHINAFTLGVREVNPNATVEVRWLYSWYDPAKAREAAESLIASGVDVLAFTEDSPTVMQVGEEYTTQKNQPVYTFSHYSPMKQYAPNSAVSGQLVNWGLIYEDILTKIYLGIYTTKNLENVDYWGLLSGGWQLGAPSSVELGAEFGEPINPKYESALKAVKVNDPLLGEISVYDLVFKRIEQMRDPAVLFDPFTGPINDQSGTQRVKPGQRLSYLELTTINWFVEGVIGEPK